MSQARNALRHKGLGNAVSYRPLISWVQNWLGQEGLTLACRVPSRWL